MKSGQESVPQEGQGERRLGKEGLLLSITFCGEEEEEEQEA